MKPQAIAQARTLHQHLVSRGFLHAAKEFAVAPLPPEAHRQVVQTWERFRLDGAYWAPVQHRWITPDQLPTRLPKPNFV